MKKLPIGIQTFSKIREGGYVYADKTGFIYDFLQGGYFFLSRPRRFGKSLLLDTISEAFLGRRELFEGLWLAGPQSDWAFEVHPVVRISMSAGTRTDANSLRRSLYSRVTAIAKKAGLELFSEDLPDAFAELIAKLHAQTGKQVVVLIDEYDKPILDLITDARRADDSRELLREFYGVLKDADPDLRLVFITGVTKFTQTSIFSGLNNIEDITLSRRYANICGISEAEFDEVFSEHLAALPNDYAYSSLEEYGCHASDVREAVFAWYDGYSWDGTSRLFNPYSLLNFFKQQSFEDFWFASGTPAFLLDLIKADPTRYTAAVGRQMTASALNVADVDAISLEALLFQTGYLTIDTIDLKAMPPDITLRVPNIEVNHALNTYVTAGLANKDLNDVNSLRRNMARALLSGQPEAIQAPLQALLSSVPYHLHVPEEAYYHSLIHVVLRLLGFSVRSEEAMAAGRADAVLQTRGGYTYILEMKYAAVEKDADKGEVEATLERLIAEAFSQIEDRGYAAPYELGRTVKNEGSSEATTSVGAGAATCAAAPRLFRVALAIAGRNAVAVRAR
jgi:hypothetical protein